MRFGSGLRFVHPNPPKSRSCVAWSIRELATPSCVSRRLTDEAALSLATASFRPVSEAVSCWLSPSTTDLSRKIDYRELVMGLGLLCASSKETLSRLVFRMFDLAGNGVLSKQSLTTILSVSSRLHGVQAESKIEAVVDQIFSESGQDGSIGLAVFQEAVKAHPELLPSMVDVDAAKHMGLA